MSVKIVAELSGNHGGKIENALDLIAYAAASGADAIKLQTFKPEAMTAPGYVIKSGPWAGRNARELYKEAYTPWEWHETLFDFAKSLGLEAFSSAFCRESVDFLVGLKVPYIKIASFENSDWPLIEYAASRKRVKLIVSLGMATEDEYEALYDILKFFDVTWLLCSSAYPAMPEHYHLQRALETDHGGHQLLKPLEWGVSDHTIGSGVACSGIALGATMIEKHITADKGTVDGHFSEADFKRFVQDCRSADAACGDDWGPFPGEHTELRRTLWAASDINKGEIISTDKIKTYRGPDGLHPMLLTEVVGKLAARAVKAEEPLTDECVQWENDSDNGGDG